MIEEERSCGVILVLRKSGDEDRFLILHQNNKTKVWSFPKGHVEGDETPKETAIRELKEETGITDIEFADLPSIREEYNHFKKSGQECHKINELFLAFAKDDKVVIQEDEVLEYKWATYQEALETFIYEDQRKELGVIKNMLK